MTNSVCMFLTCETFTEFQNIRKAGDPSNSTYWTTNSNNLSDGEPLLKWNSIVFIAEKEEIYFNLHYYGSGGEYKDKIDSLSSCYLTEVLDIYNNKHASIYAGLIDINISNTFILNNGVPQAFLLPILKASDEYTHLNGVQTIITATEACEINSPYTYLKADNRVSVQSDSFEVNNPHSYLITGSYDMDLQSYCTHINVGGSDTSANLRLSANSNGTMHSIELKPMGIEIRSPYTTWITCKNTILNSSDNLYVLSTNNIRLNSPGTDYVEGMGYYHTTLALERNNTLHTYLKIADLSKYDTRIMGKLDDDWKYKTGWIKCMTNSDYYKLSWEFIRDEPNSKPVVWFTTTKSSGSIDGTIIDWPFVYMLFKTSFYTTQMTLMHIYSNLDCLVETSSISPNNYLDFKNSDSSIQNYFNGQNLTAIPHKEINGFRIGASDCGTFYSTYVGQWT